MRIAGSVLALFVVLTLIWVRMPRSGRAVRMAVTAHTLGGIRVTDHTSTRIYIVRDIEIINGDYMKEHP